MKRAILAALALAAASTPALAAAPARAADVPKEFRYLYGSAEAAAITRQSFHALVTLALERKAERAAGKPLTQIVLAPGSTLDHPLFEACGDKPLAAVFDVDETLLLNIGLEYWDATRPDRGGALPKGTFDKWTATGFDKVAPLPGALEMVAKLRAAGITVIYNTNRDASSAADTAKSLEFAGFGRATPGVDLYTDAVGDGNKDGRRAAIASTYCVVALAGDQLGDISNLFNAGGLGVTQRRAATATPAIAPLWGEGWFLLPNPVYGPPVRGTTDEVFPDPALHWSPAP